MLRPVSDGRTVHKPLIPESSRARLSPELLRHWDERTADKIAKLEAAGDHRGLTELRARLTSDEYSRARRLLQSRPAPVPTAQAK